MRRINTLSYETDYAVSDRLPKPRVGGDPPPPDSSQVNPGTHTGSRLLRGKQLADRDGGLVVDRK